MYNCIVCLYNCLLSYYLDRGSKSEVWKCWDPHHWWQFLPEVEQQQWVCQECDFFSRLSNVRYSILRDLLNNFYHFNTKIFLIWETFGVSSSFKENIWQFCILSIASLLQLYIYTCYIYFKKHSFLDITDWIVNTFKYNKIK